MALLHRARRDSSRCTSSWTVDGTRVQHLAPVYDDPGRPHAKTVGDHVTG